MAHESAGRPASPGREVVPTQAGCDHWAERCDDEDNPPGLVAEKHAGDLNAAKEPGTPEVEWVAFKGSAIHGMGGFAKTAIRKGTRIIEYLGERISKSESLRRCEQNNACIFALSEQQDLDGNVAWNPARLLNHSCAPNCEAEKDQDRIWVVASRDIRAGEEITFNYGYDLEDYQDYPCRCGSPGCVGYIVAEVFFDHLRSRRSGGT